MAARVVGRNLGSHCPVPCLPLSGLPSLMQYVSKILVALSNGSKPAAFRGSRQAEERGRGLRQGQLVGAAVAQKERGEGWVFPLALSFRFPLSGRASHSAT